MKVVLTQEDIDTLVLYLRDGVYPENTNKDQKRAFRRKAGKYILQSNKLYCQDQNRLLEAIANDDAARINTILADLHGIDHAGMKVMYQECIKRYCGVKRDSIDQFVKNCPVCQMRLPLKRSAAIRPIIAERVWERIQVDCIDLRKYADVNNGFSWILNVLDSFSKYLFSYPMHSKSADEVRQHLELLFLSEGAPGIIQTDNGKEFVNSQISILCSKYSIIHIRGRPRHPQNQGQVERANQTLVRKISAALSGQSEKQWIDLLPAIVAQYNCRWHRAIGQAPFVLFRGRDWSNSGPNEHAEPLNELDETDTISDEPVCLLDSSSIQIESTSDAIESEFEPRSFVATEALSSANDAVLQDYRARYIQRMCQDADVHYMRSALHCGDQVLVRRDFDNNTGTRHDKLAGFYEDGIWTVVQIIHRNTFKIALNNQTKVVSRNQIKKFNS